MSEVRSTVRLNEDFHERVRVAIAKRRLRSFQQAVELALESWMSGDAAHAPRSVPAAPVATPGATKEEQALVGTFLDFLRTGDAGQVELMKHALELHSKRQRSQRKRSSA